MLKIRDFLIIITIIFLLIISHTFVYAQNVKFIDLSNQFPTEDEVGEGLYIYKPKLLFSNDNIEASCDVINYTSQDIPMIFFLAIYNNNKLEKVSTEKVTIVKGEPVTIRTQSHFSVAEDIEQGEENGIIYKVMLWDANMNPLMPIYEYNDENPFLELINSTPANDTTITSLTPEIKLQFNNQLDYTTIDNIKLFNGNEEKDVDVEFASANNEHAFPGLKELETVIIIPNIFLKPSTLYTVDFSMVKDIYGGNLVDNSTMSFITTDDKVMQVFIESDFNNYTGSQVESVIPEKWGNITSSIPYTDYAIGEAVYPRMDKSFKMHSESAYSMFIYKYNSGLRGHILFEANLYLKDTNLTRNIYFGGKGVSFSSDGSIRVNAEATGINYMSDKWYNIKSVYNLYDKTLNVYIDDELIAKDIYLGKDWPADQSIKIEQRGRNNVTGTMYIDDIVFGQMLEPIKEGVHIVRDAIITQDLIEVLEQRFPDNTHPRLIINEDRFDEIMNLVTEDSNVAKWYNTIKSQADSLLLSSPNTSSGSSFFKDQITLSTIYRLTGYNSYAEKVWQNSVEALKVENWGESFLSLSYMVKAFAISYDWLYDYWTPEQKAQLREAIKMRGLLQGINSYRNPSKSANSWVLKEDNWNPSCNGGMLMGALVIADEEPEIAAEVIESSLVSIQKSLTGFAPDGGWNEGVYYMYFALDSLAQYLSSVEVALGSDFGLLDAPGFSQSGYFPVHLTGTKGYFAFSDSEVGNGNYNTPPELFFLASVFKDSDLGGIRYNHLISNYRYARVEDLFYYTPEYNNTDIKLPLDKYFRETEVATFRSSWDSNAIFTGIKAGDNNAPHGHLDIGTFMLDAMGVRWAEELGIDSYSLPGYWEKPGRRWTYYRLDTQGQNTLVINPSLEPGQNPEAFCRIIEYNSDAEEGYAIIDMTEAYSTDVIDSKRGLMLFDARSKIILQDEIDFKSPSTFWWFMHTKRLIEVSADGKSAILTYGNKRLWAHILSPLDANFISMDAVPLPGTPNPDGQNQNTQFGKLAIEINNANKTTLSVLFVPLDSGDSIPIDLPIIKPLSEW